MWTIKIKKPRKESNGHHTLLSQHPYIFTDVHFALSSYNYAKYAKIDFLFVFVYKVFAIEEQQLNIHEVYKDNSLIICASIFVSYIYVYIPDDEFYTYLIQTYQYTLTKRIFPKSH